MARESLLLLAGCERSCYTIFGREKHVHLVVPNLLALLCLSLCIALASLGERELRT